MARHTAFQRDHIQREMKFPLPLQRQNLTVSRTPKGFLPIHHQQCNSIYTNYGAHPWCLAPEKISAVHQHLICCSVTEKELLRLYAENCLLCKKVKELAPLVGELEASLERQGAENAASHRQLELQHELTVEELQRQAEELLKEKEKSEKVTAKLDDEVTRLQNHLDHHLNEYMQSLVQQQQLAKENARTAEELCLQRQLVERQQGEMEALRAVYKQLVAQQEQQQTQQQQQEQQQQVLLFDLRTVEKGQAVLAEKGEILSMKAASLEQQQQADSGALQYLKQTQSVLHQEWRRELEHQQQQQQQQLDQQQQQLEKQQQLLLHDLHSKMLEKHARLDEWRRTQEERETNASKDLRNLHGTQTQCLEAQKDLQDRQRSVYERLQQMQQLQQQQLQLQEQRQQHSEQCRWRLENELKSIRKTSLLHADFAGVKSAHVDPAEAGDTVMQCPAGNRQRERLPIADEDMPVELYTGVLVSPEYEASYHSARLERRVPQIPRELLKCESGERRFTLTHSLSGPFEQRSDVKLSGAELTRRRVVERAFAAANISIAGASGPHDIKRLSAAQPSSAGSRKLALAHRETKRESNVYRSKCRLATGAECSPAHDSSKPHATELIKMASLEATLLKAKLQIAVAQLDVIRLRNKRASNRTA